MSAAIERFSRASLATAFSRRRGVLVLLACLVASGCDASRARGAPLLDAESRVTLAAGRAPNDVVLGDLDGDGRLDIVAANGGSSDLTVLLGRDGRRFEAAPSSPFHLEAGPHLLALASFDGDEHLDIAVTSHDENSVVVLRGIGDGGFTPMPGSPFALLEAEAAHNHGLAVGDVNADGHLDIATSNHDADNVSVLLGDGAGAFRAAPGSPFAIGNGPYPLALGDVNGDRRDDVVAPNVGAGSVAILTSSAGELAMTLKSISVEGPCFATLARLDRDDAVDLVASKCESSRITVLFGDGRGGFARERRVDAGGHAWKVRVADMNGDGRNDLVMGIASNAVTVLLGGGGGDFSPVAGSPFPAGNGPWGIAVGDLDRDGHVDVVTANTEGNDLTLLFGGTSN